MKVKLTTDSPRIDGCWRGICGPRLVGIDPRKCGLGFGCNGLACAAPHKDGPDRLERHRIPFLVTIEVPRHRIPLLVPVAVEALQHLRGKIKFRARRRHRIRLPAWPRRWW